MKRRLVLAWLPFLLVLVLGQVWHLSGAIVPVLQFRVDLATLLTVLAGVLSLAAFSAALVSYRTEIKQQSLREQSEENRRQFMRRLDHELKNPLTAIRAALANLEVEPAFENGTPALQGLERQTARLTRLTGDLRKLADLEQVQLEQLPVDIAQLLEDTVAAVRTAPLACDRELRLSLSRIPWPLPAVIGDRDLLSLAFYNLIENALKFSGEGSPVEVRASEDGRKVSVEVADSGPGIDPADLPRVFDELYRGSNARGKEGAGIGLALVQRIISRHNGEISLRSRTGSETGTVFTVRLPASSTGEIVTNR